MCGAPVPRDAEFCSACGVHAPFRAPGSHASSDWSTSSWTQALQPSLAQIGRDQAIGIAGGALALIASFLPFVTPRSLITEAEHAIGLTIPGLGSKALIEGGAVGALVPILAVALAIGCAVKLRAPFELAAFAASAGALGLVVGAGALGVGLFPGSLSFGFFVSILGFGGLLYSYARRVYAPAAATREVI
jgi:hypothetical protein